MIRQIYQKDTKGGLVPDVHVETNNCYTEKVPLDINRYYSLTNQKENVKGYRSYYSSRDPAFVLRAPWLYVHLSDKANHSVTITIL